MQLIKISIMLPNYCFLFLHFTLTRADLLFFSFTINSETGLISTGSQLDREARESVELTVEARDGGSPQLATTCIVVVDILDYNDNDPRVSIIPRTQIVGGL